jgi:hypothetical protein
LHADDLEIDLKVVERGEEGSSKSVHNKERDFRKI